jgi:HlyD family secretion protein
MTQDQPKLDDLRIDRAATGQTRSAGPWALLAILLLLGAVGAFLWLGRASPVTVKTAIAREAASNGGARATLLNASGYVTARREATVSSKVTGKVIEVLVEEGMKVEAGQVLARLDSANAQASLRLSEAQLAATRATLNETEVRVREADREFRRVQQLSSEGIATATDLDRAGATLDSLKARLEQQSAQVTVAEREVALWKQQLDDTTVRAPFAGIVTAKNAQPGEMISPMSAGGFTRTGICTIVDMSSLEIEVDVNESYINRVQSGQPVEATLDSYPDWRIPSKVIAIIPTADRQKATVKVRVGFDQLDSRILPHMGVKVAFQGAGEEGAASRRGIVIPKGALRQEDGRDFVWVFQNGRAERRAVTTSFARNDEVVLAAGLSSGERVIVNAPADLKADGPVQEEKR